MARELVYTRSQEGHVHVAMHQDADHLYIPNVPATGLSTKSRKQVQNAAARELLRVTDKTIRARTFVCADPRSRQQWTVHDNCAWEGRLVKDLHSKRLLTSHAPLQWIALEEVPPAVVPPAVLTHFMQQTTPCGDHYITDALSTHPSVRTTQAVDHSIKLVAAGMLRAGTIVATASWHAVEASSGGYVQPPYSKERRNKSPGVSRGRRRKGERQ